MVFQLRELSAHKNCFDAGTYGLSIGFGQVVICRLARPLDHGQAGNVGALARLNVVSVFNDVIILKPKHLKSDIGPGEVVFGMGEDIVAVFEGAHDVDPGRGLRQALEQFLQPLTAFLGLRVVLDILLLIDDSDRFRLSGFDAFEQRADLGFSVLDHRYHQVFLFAAISGSRIRLHPRRDVALRDL